MTLKIKDKKIIWTKLYFRLFSNEKFKLLRVFLCIKDPDLVFSRIRIRVTQKDQFHPDPQHWFLLPLPQPISAPLAPFLDSTGIT